MNSVTSNRYFYFLQEYEEKLNQLLEQVNNINQSVQESSIVDVTSEWKKNVKSRDIFLFESGKERSKIYAINFD